MTPSVLLFTILWRVFPLLPAGFLVPAMIAKYIFKRDATIVLVHLAGGVQLLIGITMIGMGLTIPELAATITMPLSPWDYGIVFRYEPIKLYFLGAFLIPLAFSLFRMKQLPSSFFRMVFLLYLTGASGLIATGDIFNFFVFYEVMIIGAYILIAIDGDYGASIKYMIIGSVSSSLFLAGTVVLYTTGAYFDFTFADDLSMLPAGNLRIAMYLFAMAFFVKAAFFPASGWVASCHAAANSMISAFLAAFTIFSGIIGLYYFVLIPAENMGDQSFFLLLRISSLITMPVAAIFLFWESRLKRAIAASTVFTIGIVGLLLSYQAYTMAFSYILVHGFYKSLLFFVYGECSIDSQRIRFQRLQMMAFLLGLVFTAGLFPSVTWFLKAEFLLSQGLYKGLFAVSIAFLAGGFMKFQYSTTPGPHGRFYLTLSLTIMAVFYALLYSNAIGGGHALIFPSAIELGIDTGALLGGLLFGRRIFRHFPSFHNIDRSLVYTNLNRELFLILVMGLVAFIIVF